MMMTGTSLGSVGSLLPKYLIWAADGGDILFLRYSLFIRPTRSPTPECPPSSRLPCSIERSCSPEQNPLPIGKTSPWFFSGPCRFWLMLDPRCVFLCLEWLTTAK